MNRINCARRQINQSPFDYVQGASWPRALVVPDILRGEMSLSTMGLSRFRRQD